jgi:hypothetical protein
MSGNLKLNTSSGGSIALTPADTVSNITVTVPATTGTLATSESTLAQFNATGSAPVYACRAWVNFNGTGTVAIRASGNVSSITDNGTGDYTVNFTTAMQDANYGFTTGSRVINVPSVLGIDEVATAPTSSLCRFKCRRTDNDALIDQEYLSIAFFR